MENKRFKKFRLVAILFLLCAVILQAFPVNNLHAEEGEIRLDKYNGSRKSDQPMASVFRFNSEADQLSVKAIRVNDEDYEKVENLNDVSSSGKYFVRTGYGEWDIYLSKLKQDDIVKFWTNTGYLKVIIKNPDSNFGAIHDKKNVSFVKEPFIPKPEPQEPEQPGKVTLKVFKNNQQNKFYFEISPKPENGYVEDVSVNNISYTKGESEYSIWHGQYKGIGYYLNDGNLHMLEPNREKNIITLTYKDGKKHSFEYKNTNKDGDILEELEETPAPTKLRLRLEGSFEPAMVAQKEYDGVSSATVGGANSNKNSNVVLKATYSENPSDEDWVLFDTLKVQTNGVPELLLDAESGMKGVYNSIGDKSAFTLSGTPKTVGKYEVKAVVEEANGIKTETENTLTFSVYDYNGELTHYLNEDTMREQKYGLKKMQDGKYIWDMEPWAIRNFGGVDETVTVPKELKAWYGSHESGKYGYLGYYPAENVQELIIDKDTNLTLVNMLVYSSVKIIVKDGGVLNLMNSSIHGKIEVENGGTLQVNYNAHTKEFGAGSSINGQIELKEGAILENSLIYSNTNYLPDGDKARHNVNPVVKVTGNAVIKGEVFIRGDEAPTGTDLATGKPYTGQPALSVENITLTIDKDAILGTYGGGRVALSSIGSSAVKLEEGKIEGEGRFLAIAGRTEYREAKEAVEGKGTLATAKMYLQGGDTYDKNGKGGEAKSASVIIKEAAENRKPVGKLLKGEVLPKPVMDYHQPYYWKDMLAKPPVPDFGDAELEVQKENSGNQGGQGNQNNQGNQGNQNNQGNQGNQNNQGNQGNQNNQGNGQNNQGNQPNNNSASVAPVLPVVPVTENNQPAASDNAAVTDNAAANPETNVTEIAEDATPQGEANTDADEMDDSDEDMAEDGEKEGKTVKAIKADNVRKNDNAAKTDEEAAKDVEDDKMPLGDAKMPENKASLPKTGGVPAGLFVLAGLSLVALGVKVRKQR